MSTETLEKPKSFRLDLPHRNALQKKLMEIMLGQDALTGDQVEWIHQYGKKVSDIIDSPEYEDIRDLAREERYQEAAEKVLGFLN